MYDLRRLQHLANGARLCALLAFGLAHLQVSAQGAGPLEMPQRLDRFHIWVNGNIVTNKYASEAEEYGARMAQNARIYGRQETGGVSLSKQLAINTKNGIVVAEAKQLLNARSIAKGIATVVTGGGALGLAIQAAPYILDLFRESGLAVQDGVVGLYLGDSCNDNCKEYSYTEATGGTYMKPSVFDAAMRSWYLGATSPRSIGNSSISGNQWTATYTLTAPCCGGVPAGTTGTISYTVQSRAVAPYTGEFSPATPQQIEDAIAAKNPSPAVLKELADKGGHAPNPDPADKPKIENILPSQEKTTTKTNPDGSTETTTCRTNGTSTSTGSIKLTESCTITQKDAQGNPTSTTTTNSDSDPVPKAEESMLCTVFPNIAACAELDTPEGDIPTASETIGYTAENHFGGGSCPADKTMTLATTGQAMTVWNWSQACSAITDYFRPLFITLCTLTALFILAPGVKEGA